LLQAPPAGLVETAVIRAVGQAVQALDHRVDRRRVRTQCREQASSLSVVETRIEDVRQPPVGFVLSLCGVGSEHGTAEVPAHAVAVDCQLALERVPVGCTHCERKARATFVGARQLVRLLVVPFLQAVLVAPAVRLQRSAQFVGVVPLGDPGGRQPPPFGQLLGSGLDARLFTDLSTLSHDKPDTLLTPIERFVRLADKSDLPVRVRAIAFSPTTRSGRDLSEIRELDRLQETGSNVTVSGIKWILDGTPIERGAALRDDYADRPGWYGKLNFPERDIAAMLKESLELQQQLLLHAVGDKTADVVFDAMEIVNGGNVDWKSKRLRIEHGEGVIADLIPRARALGVVVVQNPSHFTFVELFRQRWHSPMGPLRSLIEADIPVALGSDGPMNPFLNIMFAITDPTNPPEAITREQAVRAYTSGSAFAEFAEQDKGTIAAGKLADIAVLSQDPFSVAVPDLPRTRSVLTIVGGKVVYEEH